jgi:hypothetical protein
MTFNRGSTADPKIVAARLAGQQSIEQRIHCSIAVG